MDEIFLSKEGLEELKRQLKQLEEHDYPEVLRQLSDARAQGDLRENAEYDAAKEEKKNIERRIKQLSEKISVAKVISRNDIDNQCVRLLSTVEVYNSMLKKNVSYTLVAEDEADVFNNKISVSSPIGKSLIGKKIGDTVDIQISENKISLKIISIK